MTIFDKLKENEERNDKILFLKENYTKIKEVIADPTMQFKTMNEAFNYGRGHDGRPLKGSFQEAIDVFGASTMLGNNYMNQVFNSDGILWQGVSGYGSPTIFITYFVWLSTIWFNRYQRFAARYAVMSTESAAAAVNTSVDLIWGSNGFDYIGKSKAAQKKIDEFVKQNNYKNKSKKIIHDFFVDGDVFIRKFGDEVRFIDPDLVYQMTGPTDRSYLGILYSPNDTEDIRGYEVHSTPYGGPGENDSDLIPADEINHLANSMFGLLRGFSWFLPIFPDVFGVDKIQTTLTKTLAVQCAVAWTRRHNTPLPGVINMTGAIQGQPQNQPPLNNQTSTTSGVPTTGEHYPPASILDGTNTWEYDLPKVYETEGFNGVIDMLYRKISSHFSLPNSIYSNNREERGAYAGEIASGSWLAQSLGARQSRFMEFDKKNISDCTGIDIDDIKVNGPKIGAVDKKAEVEEELMLLDRGLISDETMSKRKGLDFNDEQEKIKKEMTEKNKLGLINKDEDKLDLH